MKFFNSRNFLADPNRRTNELEPHHQCTIHINSETVSQLQQAYQEALNGKPSTNPMIEMVKPLLKLVNEHNAFISSRSYRRR